jgi:hypothetical protein
MLARLHIIGKESIVDIQMGIILFKDGYAVQKIEQ